MIEILILDVGHGNSAVITDGETVVVVDSPPDDTLIRVLRHRDLRVVEHLVLSHSDDDHVGGAIPLIAAHDIEVRHVYLNPDALKRTRAWEALIKALEDAQQRQGTATHAELSNNTGPSLSFEGCEIQILFPNAADALHGVGGVLEGDRLSANSMSAVIRVETEDGRSVLFAGDSDEVALRAMAARETRFQAGVLVYPHHGGKARRHSTPQHEHDFAGRLTDAVGADVVAFSMGRTRYANPRPDVLKGVRDAREDTRIVCTQLSQRCARNPGAELGHVNDPSSGETDSFCCAGSLRVSAPGEVAPDREGHLRFIAAYADNPMCLSSDLRRTHGAST